MGSVLVVFLALVLAWPGYLIAQEVPGSTTVSPQDQTPAPDKTDPVKDSMPQPSFGRLFLRDEKDLWLSPLKVKRSDAKWLLPLGAGAAVLMTQDRDMSNAVRNADDVRPASRLLSR